MKFFLPAIIFLSIYFNASSQNTFQKVIPGDGYITGIHENPDGSIISSGIIGNESATKSFLIKTDSNGDTLWTHTYNDSVLTAVGPCLAKTLDNGYVITGMSYNTGAYVIRTDSVGNVTWAKKIEGWYPTVQSIIVLSDSGILIGGEFIGSITQSQDLFLIKFNSNGDSIWTKAYGGNGSEYGSSIDETMDGGIIIGGYSDSFHPSYLDYYLIRTDATGDILWSNTYESITGVAVCHSVIQTLEGGYIIGGWQGMLKTDSSGNIIWQYNYQSAFGLSTNTIVQTADSGYIESGKIVDNSSTEGAFLLKTDPAGNYLWRKAFNLGEYNGSPSFRNYVIQTMDSGFITSGPRHYPFDTIGISVIKTDKNGNNSCNQHDLIVFTVPMNLQQNNVTTNLYPTAFTINSITFPTSHLDSVITICSSLTYNDAVVEEEKAFSISPNPAENHFSISNPSKSIKEILIYNPWGQIVFSSNVNPNTESITINCNHFPKGIYFVKATSNSGSVVKKIVIE